MLPVVYIDLFLPCKWILVFFPARQVKVHILINFRVCPAVIFVDSFVDHLNLLPGAEHQTCTFAMVIYSSAIRPVYQIPEL